MRSLIWPLPTRIFHWMLVTYVILMLLTSEAESFLTWHAAFGYGIALLLFFRLLWGIVGPQYARFSTWPLSITALKAFLQDIRHPQTAYPGHNPAASWVMLGILAVLLLTVASGVLTYGTQEGRGLFAFLNHTWFREMELFEEVHESFSALLWILVALHLGGVASDCFMHPERGTLGSIFSGYKNIQAPEVTLSLLQKLIAILFLSAALLTPPYLIMSKDTPLTQSRYATVDYEKSHPLFVEECASCHTLYPPFLLPRASWKKMMTTLEDHFGDDASLEKKDRLSIETYLLQHSAESSTKESAFYILKSVNGKKDIIAITETPYWKRRHQVIDPKDFNRTNVRSKANCKACHGQFEQGLLEDDQIAIPEQGA